MVLLDPGSSFRSKSPTHFSCPPSCLIEPTPILLSAQACRCPVRLRESCCSWQRLMTWTTFPGLQHLAPSAALQCARSRTSSSLDGSDPVSLANQTQRTTWQTTPVPTSAVENRHAAAVARSSVAELTAWLQPHPRGSSRLRLTVDKAGLASKPQQQQPAEQGVRTCFSATLHHTVPPNTPVLAATMPATVRTEMTTALASQALPACCIPPQAKSHTHRHRLYHLIALQWVPALLCHPRLPSTPHCARPLWVLPLTTPCGTTRLPSVPHRGEDGRVLDRTRPSEVDQVPPARRRCRQERKPQRDS